jgi:hypothetical protein
VTQDRQARTVVVARAPNIMWEQDCPRAREILDAAERRRGAAV